MAINKAVPKSAKTHGGMRNCIEYVLKEEKTYKDLIYITGPFCFPDITYDTVYQTFLKEKRLWDKDRGRMSVHNIISWHKDEKITPEEAFEFGKEFIDRWFDGFQTLMAVHLDREHIHVHMVTNTVSFLDGHKLHSSKKDLEKMKQLTNEMCKEKGLTVAIKGQRFDGTPLPQGHVRAWSKDKYRLLQKQMKDSYVAKCAMAVLETKENVCSRQEFIELMDQLGWQVIWKPNRKNITFVNDEGEKVRDSNITKIFNVEITKEALEHEFIANNARRTSVRREAEYDGDELIDPELAEYYRQVQEACAGTGTGDSAEGFEDISVAEVMPGERRSIREALATKGRTKGAAGTEDRKREEQLSVSEPHAKRNRRRTR